MRSAILILAVFLAVGCHAEVRNGFKGYKVYRLAVETQTQLDFLTKMNDALQEQQLTDEVDFWTASGVLSKALPQSLLIMVAPGQQLDMLTALEKENIKHTVQIDDLAVHLELESRMSPEDKEAEAKGHMTWTAYHRYPAMETFFQELATTYPDLVSKTTLGQSYEGRNIYLMKLGKPRADGKMKPAIWMDSQIHAREWLASATLLYMMNKMLTGYATNPKAQRMLDEIDWYIIPVVNVDGFEHSHLSTSTRMWRGTKRVNPFHNSLGADPNRNYDYKWMYSGATQDSGGQIYAGAYPFSEVENIYLTDAVLERKGQIKVLLTFHTAAEMWLTPWGYDTSLPTDYNDLYNMGVQATNALYAVNGIQYDVGSSTSLLGAAAGATDDWGKAKGGIKYSYTVELRDRGFMFTIPPSHIVPSGEETFEAINVVASMVRAEYGATLN